VEGYNLFVEMMAQIRRNVIYSVYQVGPATHRSPPHAMPFKSINYGQHAFDDVTGIGLAEVARHVIRHRMPFNSINEVSKCVG